MNGLTYEFIRGPLLSAVLILVVIFHIYRIVQLFQATSRLPRKKPGVRNREARNRYVDRWRQFIVAGIQKFRTHFRNTIFGMNPVAVWTTTVYHLIIFISFFLWRDTMSCWTSPGG